MKINLRKLMPVAIFGGLALVAIIIRMNPPEAPQRPAFDGPMMSVATLPVLPRDYQVMLQSYGTVQPRTRSMLVAQVGGLITSINENVRDGGFFRLDDHLDRFFASMAALRMKVPHDRAEMAEILTECVRRAGLRDSYVAMVTTRGVPAPGLPRLPSLVTPSSLTPLVTRMALLPLRQCW